LIKQVSFNRSIFHNKKCVIKTDSLIELFNDLIIKYKFKNHFEIYDLSSLNDLRINSLLFLDNENFNKKINFDKTCIITSNQKIYEEKEYENIILVKDFNSSYVKILNHIYGHEDTNDYHDDFLEINGSFISKLAEVASSAMISKNCVIGRGVRIGDNSIIKNNVVIKNAIIGKNVIISDNTTIGSTGFGFDIKNLGSKSLFPQLGIVIIEDNVHIGANCTIDRAKLDTTHIGKNSMIDNLVHIGHNVKIEMNACIAAQSGISGSVIIGKNLISGGQSGYAGHIKIGDNVIVAAKSGVTKSIKNNCTVAGFPATDIKIWKKKIIKERKNGYK